MRDAPRKKIKYYSKNYNIEPGSKFTKATKLGIKILDEKEFFKLLGKKKNS
jgi:NAD-dependent DNA ligase